MERHRIGHQGRIHTWQGNRADWREASAGLQTGVLGKKLVGRGQAARETGEVEAQRSNRFLYPIHQLLQGCDRAPMGRADGDQFAGVGRATLPLHIPAGHEAAHGMADQDQPRLAVGFGQCTPALQGRLHHRPKAAGVVAVGEAPVVGKGQQVGGLGGILWIGWNQRESLREPVQQPAVADVGAPESRQKVQIWHQRQRFHPIAGMVIAQVSGEGEGLDTGAETPDRLPHSTARRRPNLLAITGQGAAQNAWEHHHQVTHLKTLSLCRHKEL